MATFWSVISIWLSLAFSLIDSLMLLRSQPLHVGFTSDAGGNTIMVRWYRRKANLHHVRSPPNSSPLFFCSARLVRVLIRHFFNDRFGTTKYSTEGEICTTTRVFLPWWMPSCKTSRYVPLPSIEFHIKRCVFVTESLLSLQNKWVGDAKVWSECPNGEIACPDV